MSRKTPYKTPNEKKLRDYYMNLISKPFTAREFTVIAGFFKKDVEIIKKENRLYRGII